MKKYRDPKEMLLMDNVDIPLNKSAALFLNNKEDYPRRRRWWIFIAITALFAGICIFFAVGGKVLFQSDYAEKEILSEDAMTSENFVSDEGVTWTKRMVVDLFRGHWNPEQTQISESGVEVIDCVLTADSAYDLVGVVQYRHEECLMGLAFMKSNGSIYLNEIEKSAAGAVPEDAPLVYEGNGKVSLWYVKNNKIYDYAPQYTPQGTDENSRIYYGNYQAAEITGEPVLRDSEK